MSKPSFYNDINSVNLWFKTIYLLSKHDTIKNTWIQKIKLKERITILNLKSANQKYSLEDVEVFIKKSSCYLFSGKLLLGNSS